MGPAESLRELSVAEVKPGDGSSTAAGRPAISPPNVDFSLGDLPAQPEEDLDEDEDEGVSISTGCACCFWVSRTARRVHGGTTCIWMELLLLAGLVYCSIEAAAQHVLPPLGTSAVILLGSLIALIASALLRLTWLRLIVYPFFPESMVIAFVTRCIDPELWTLIFAVAQFVMWKSLVRQGPSGRWDFDFLSELWTMGGMSDTHKFILEMVLMVNMLWGIRNAIVKAIMLKLMLGFLMNYNDEMIGLLRKYGLLRQLNSGWIKLIPVMTAMAPDQSVLTDASQSRVTPLNCGLSNTLMPPDNNTNRALRELSSLRTARGDISKTQLYETIKATLREESRSRLQKDTSKYTVLREASKRISFLQAEDARGDEAAVPIADDQVREPPHSLMSRATPALRRKRVREFNVQITGRSLPLFLEKNILQALPKSLIANMVAIEWVRNEPIVLFVESRWVDLISKTVARQTGSQLFESLLSLQQSLDSFQDELANDLAETSHASLAAQRGLDFNGMVRRWRHSHEMNATGSVRLRENSGPLAVIHESIAPLVRLDVSHGAPPPDHADGSGQDHALVRMPGNTSISADGEDADAMAASRHWLYRGPGPESLIRQTESLSMGVAMAQHGDGSPPQASPQTSPQASPQQAESLDVVASGRRRLLHRGPLKKERSSSVNELRHNTIATTRTQIGHNGRVPNDAQLAAITAAEIKKVKVILPDDRSCLSQDFFELFMTTADIGDLMNFLDPGRLGKVTSSMFIKGVVSLYRQRKQLVHSLESQEQIEKTFRRTCLLFVTFVMLLVFLVYLGVNPNTITVSGAAILSATSIVLSSVYTDFIQSTILMVFLNPYRIGDRVRIDGEAQYVKRITTYFTEFESLHGRIQYIAHKELASKLLINESRCKMATTEVNVYFGEKTTPAQYAAFKKVLDAFLKSRPLEWVGDSLFVYVMGIGPSQYVQVSIWATHTEGWGNWMAVRTQESTLFLFIMRQATLLGITYRLPIQRWEPYIPPTQTTARGNTQSSVHAATQAGAQRYPVFETQGIHSAAPPEWTLPGARTHWEPSAGPTVPQGIRMVTGDHFWALKTQRVISHGFLKPDTESFSVPEESPDIGYYQYANEYDEAMGRIDAVEDLREQRLLGLRERREKEDHRF